MKRIALLPVFFLWGCLSDEGGGSSQPLTLGKYRASITQKWYEDDPAPRRFIDEQTLLPDHDGEGKMYLVRAGDTVLLCEGTYSWEQQGSSLRIWEARQRCKDPDYLAGGFDAWQQSFDTTTSSIRNVTSTGFEMRGQAIDSIVFWAKYILVP